MPELIYEGPASISSRGISPADTTEAGQPLILNQVTLNMPVESPRAEVDDEVVVLSSMRNPLLVGCEFVVKSLRPSTYAIQQVVFVEQRLKKQPR